MWKKTGAVYDGDWKDNMRHGFGMYSIKQGDAYVKQYSGGWKEDMRDVSCIVWQCFLLVVFEECRTLLPKALFAYWTALCASLSTLHSQIGTVNPLS